MMRRNFAAGCLVVSATTLVACSGDSTDEAASAAVSTTAAPTTTSVSLEVNAPPAPRQTGAVQVRFDPCVSVGDDLVTRAGFDPATRERSVGESVSSLMTTIGCQFWREALVDGEKYPTGGLEVTSSNTTLDEIKRNPGFSIFNSDPIDGREAVLYRIPQVPGSCTASIKSSDGTFNVALIVPPGPIAVPEPCDQIREFAEILSESLGSN